ncbi:hypothetical protein IPM65_04775 [Candidatus Roizmanbacteria bacterium]|nr:MAG: hypothetical protein IPM65_04775 [Candidatus Roizmanbacteria bacterium]
MKFQKYKQRLMVWFSSKDILNLVLSSDIESIVHIFRKEVKDREQDIKQIMASSANDRDKHELWIAIFGLTQEFNNDCEFGFYLKDSFRLNQTEITSFEDLKEQKTDPPDILVKTPEGIFEFELKRYRQSIDKESLAKFIRNKVLRYSDPYNFYIVIQPSSDNAISLKVFEELHEELNKLFSKRNEIGRICFSCNVDSEYLLSIHVYPKFHIYKIPYVKGSDQVKKL